ncbi:9404_t:CDS:2 [Funneliformis mosseae]|uniref:9404_t:CDS:1 n=1 Tax=Funneliformis mosseae TaxID=27381 RepID=A0A9N9ADA4_FUNMO|nr:9404_t:CDS:2 [Funneliformis mosseae]
MSESNEVNAQSKIKARLLSCNLFLRPPLIKNNYSDYKEDRLAYFIDNVLANYDIICLEEMFSFGSSRRTRLLEAADKAGFKYSLTLPCKVEFKIAIDGGLVLLIKKELPLKGPVKMMSLDKLMAYNQPYHSLSTRKRKTLRTKTFNIACSPPYKESDVSSSRIENVSV